MSGPVLYCIQYKALNTSDFFGFRFFGFYFECGLITDETYIYYFFKNLRHNFLQRCFL